MIDPDIQAALQHHQAGRLAAAEAIYRKILVENPNHPDALHLLGALAGQCGHTDAAIDLMRRAISAKPDYLQAFKNLGAILAQADRFPESASTYREALAVAPNDPTVHNDLGSILLRQKQWDEAIGLFSEAIDLDPEFADAYKNLSYARRKKGLIDEALVASARAVELQPDFADAIYEHAVTLDAAGRPEEALAEFRRALECNPDLPDAYNEIGKILGEMGRLDESIAVYAKAIQLTPDRAILHFNLGNALRNGDRMAEAVAAFNMATQVKPDYLEAHAGLAIALAKLQRFEEALASHARAAALNPNAAITHEAMGEIALRKLDARTAAEHFRRACAADPGAATSLIGLGIALQAQGKFDEAQATFRKVIELHPQLVGIYQHLARTGTLVASQGEIKRLTELLEQTGVYAAERAAAEFALGKTLDEMDQFDEAFAHYVQANSIVKQYRALAGERYDPEEFRRSIDEMIEVFTPPFFQERQSWGESSELPVFIVGMPRSGTTLIHQIAASHPGVNGIGERSDISTIAKRLGGGEVRSAALGWQHDSVNEAATQLLKQYRSMNDSALRIVDKQPGNVTMLGLISLLFPQARVILCRRDPRDNCLSCYFQNFASGNLFAFDLADCGLHQVQNYRLMDHWLKALPIQMLEVHYEAVVGDLEGQARRLIDFLGLPWDPACLNFPEAKAAVLTASAWQVRQPIYNHSVARWRNYERHLGPLLEALGNIPGT